MIDRTTAWLCLVLFKSTWSDSICHVWIYAMIMIKYKLIGITDIGTIFKKKILLPSKLGQLRVFFYLGLPLLLVMIALANLDLDLRE